MPATSPSKKRKCSSSFAQPAGIILLSPWLDQPSFLATVETGLDHDELFAYLSEQVFQRLPERWREFLVATSVAQDISVDLCVEALDYSDAASLLRDLESAGLFLTVLHDGTTYRYHALFRQFLLDRAARDPAPDPAGVTDPTPQPRRRTGARLASEGSFEGGSRCSCFPATDQ